MKRLALVLTFALVLAQPLYAAVGTVMPTPFQTVQDGSGNPISGGKVCSFIAGTTTPVATYTDAGLSVANNPVITADSAGRFVAFLTPGVSYKFTYQSAAGTANTCDGVTYRTVDNVIAVPGSAAGVDVSPAIAGENIAAGNAVYLSDGSGGKISGQWYKADSANTYSSLTNIVGMAPSAITSSSSGSVRISGAVTGLSALSVGASYFVGTAGAVTSTAPAMSRYIGQADSATSLILAPQPIAAAVAVDTSICGGRLTLTTAVPVTTADVTAATTVFYTPYQSNRCALYTGTFWTIRNFAELSIAVPASTSQMYDVWLFDNAGTATLELLAWTNDTTRATALVMQDGVLSKTGALTRRYVGSMRTTTVSGQTEDSIGKRYLFNQGNRVARLLQRYETTQTWTYQTATVRQANGAVANQVEVIIGLADTMLDLGLSVGTQQSGGNIISAGIGEDSLTTYVAGQAVTNNSSGSIISVRLTKFPVVGKHVYSWNEWSTAAGTTTWSGVTAGAGSTITSGLTGMIVQ